MAVVFLHKITLWYQMAVLQYTIFAHYTSCGKEIIRSKGINDSREHECMVVEITYSVEKKPDEEAA